MTFHKSIAVLGGTFDPIHNAHLQLAHFLHDTLKFNTILFIPCKQNLLKTLVPAHNQARIEMIELALQPFPYCQCDAREIQRDTPSYTIDTLKSLRHDYPHHSLTFTMGVDAFNDLEQWHYFEDFLTYAHLLIFSRPSYKLQPTEKLRKLIAEAETKKVSALHQEKAGHIYFTSIPNYTTSSTEVRALLKQKDYAAVSAHLPEAVLQYIKDNALYLAK